MAHRSDCWFCDICDTEFNTQLQADICHWSGLEFRSMSDITIGIDFNDVTAYLLYEVCLWFNNSEIRLRIREAFGDGIEIMEVLFADDWFSERVTEVNGGMDRFVEMLHELHYELSILPAIGELKFEIPLPLVSERQPLTLKVE